MRALPLLVLLTGCPGGGEGPSFVVSGDGGPPIPRIGRISIEVQTACATPVVFPGEAAPVLVRSPAVQGSEMIARVVEGPGALVEAEVDTARRPLISGAARFNLECGGFGVVRLFARDAEGRTTTSDAILCARPSGYDRACRSAVPPRPLGEWRIEQFSPTGARGRRLAPAGQGAGTLTDRKPLALRLVFEGGVRPATTGRIAVEIEPGGPEGVTVVPDAQATDLGTGEAVFDLAAGSASGAFVLRYTADLDGGRRTLSSEPFVVTAPPAVGAEIACERGDRPLAAFDSRGGLVDGGAAAICTLRARADQGPPVEGTRFWILSEAGVVVPGRGRLGPGGEVEFSVAVGGRPPVDAAPPGPSPLDGVVTVVGVVEGAEVEDGEEPYVDADDDGEHGPGESFLDTDGDGAWSAANGVSDEVTLHWAQTRLRWVGPIADAPATLGLACLPPDCSPTPVAGVHDACPDGAHAYLLPGAVVEGSARPADRNGQCTTEAGVATLFITPDAAATVTEVDVPLGPCGPAGLRPTPFTLRLKRAAPGPFVLGLGLPDGGLVERTLCAP